jgi:hypothetical protein
MTRVFITAPLALRDSSNLAPEVAKKKPGDLSMNQIIAYAQGPDWGLGLLALATAFKHFNAWVMERFKDQASIYSCYAELFL